jgi:hypothetical protein
MNIIFVSDHQKNKSVYDLHMKEANDKVKKLLKRFIRQTPYSKQITGDGIEMYENK